MRILLDSNAYSAFMRGNYEVRDLIRAAEEVLFSAVVVGEQLFGFRQGGTTGGTLRSFDPSLNVHTYHSFLLDRLRLTATHAQ